MTLALVLAVAMVAIMTIAGFIGAAVPLVLRRIRVDPAVASAVVVTTLTDVLGLLLGLGIATAAISLIVEERRLAIGAPRSLPGRASRAPDLRSWRRRSSLRHAGGPCYVPSA